MRILFVGDEAVFPVDLVELVSAMGIDWEVERCADAPEGDRVELWGRRIGRSLSLVGVVVLAWWLGHQLKFW